MYNADMDDVVSNAKTVFGLKLTDNQVQQLILYERMLLEWNSKINLTAIRTSKDIHTKHFLDSMACMLVLKTCDQRVIDIGTGAGFPGIVLKICIPDISLTLVESRGKKARFCTHVVEALDLSSVEVVQQRAEILGRNPDYKEQFDVAVARAVAPLSKLAKYLLPFVKIGGYAIAMKGRNAQEEMKQVENLLCDPISYTLPGETEGKTLVVIKKNR
jgi:16S rRNA (guanine527-N7)-methyltransferase